MKPDRSQFGLRALLAFVFSVTTLLSIIAAWHNSATYRARAIVVLPKLTALHAMNVWWIDVQNDVLWDHHYRTAEGRNVLAKAVEFINENSECPLNTSIEELQDTVKVDRNNPRSGWMEISTYGPSPMAAAFRVTAIRDAYEGLVIGNTDNSVLNKRFRTRAIAFAKKDGSIAIPSTVFFERHSFDTYSLNSNLHIPIEIETERSNEILSIGIPLWLLMISLPATVTLWRSQTAIRNTDTRGTCNQSP